MVVRLILVLFVVIGLVWGWKTGVLESIRSGGIPEIGRESPINGPDRKGVVVAIDQPSLAREIDSRFPVAASEKVSAVAGMQKLFDDGALALVPERSKVKVIENGSVMVLAVPYPAVKVRLLDGRLKGVEVWIERNDLTDTPVQAAFQAMRQGHNSSAAK